MLYDVTCYFVSSKMIFEFYTNNLMRRFSLVRQICHLCFLYTIYISTPHCIVTWHCRYIPVLYGEYSTIFRISSHEKSFNKVVSTNCHLWGDTVHVVIWPSIQFYLRQYIPPDMGLETVTCFRVTIHAPFSIVT